MSAQTPQTCNANTRCCSMGESAKGGCHEMMLEHLGPDTFVGRVARRASSQPRWLWGAPLLIAGVLFLVPVMLPVAIALLAFVMMYALLSLLHGACSRIARLLRAA